jgi:hypothetical protein
MFQSSWFLKLGVSGSCAIAVLLLAVSLQAQVDDTTRQLSRDILKQLIEINTTDSVGNVSTAAEAMAQRLRDAGLNGAALRRTLSRAGCQQPCCKRMKR